MTKRVTYLIDKQGKIAGAFDGTFDADPHLGGVRDGALFEARVNVRVRAVVTMALVVAGTVAGCPCTARVRPDHTLADGRTHGGEIYGRMCAVCHGASGEGYKADEATALAQPDFLASVSDEFFRSAITNGRDGTTMSAWGTERGGPLAKPDVDALIAFLRTRGDGRTVKKLDEHPLAGGAMRGATMFAKDCARCHGARGTGGPNVSIGNPQLLLTASNGFLRLAITNGRPTTLMPCVRSGPRARWRTSSRCSGAGNRDQARRQNARLLRNHRRSRWVPCHSTRPGVTPTDFTPTPGYTEGRCRRGCDLRRGAKMGILPMPALRRTTRTSTSPGR